jgi:predicted HicB family RNase H-like nuclease
MEDKILNKREIMKENCKKIIFEIPENLHRDIKITAAKRNVSMSLWIQRALAQKIQSENRQNNE